MNRAKLAMAAVVVLALLGGCVGEPDNSESNVEEGDIDQELTTETYPAAGTDKVWTCIGWDDFNGHKMECELVEGETR